MIDEELYQAVQMARCDVIGSARALLQARSQSELNKAIGLLREAFDDLDEARRRLDASETGNDDEAATPSSHTGARTR